ncbi:hypothetical protein PHISCL_04956 [Aspergillus sclerotialis]|uniref:Glycoside hydrolase subgroup catalytic core n=1 Tax=Aspergillus sclerotialis TaxID=2070753 RepID=A0A3A2ZXH0_9EURO|nr:hypothetical protein PHISCL_04956 [Aspergillus sclerotialis]
MSLYTAEDEAGSVIVDAGISYMYGERFEGNHAGELEVEIVIEGSKDRAVHTVPLNSSSNEIGLSLAALQPRFEPYNLTLTASVVDGDRGRHRRVYSATTELYRKPMRTDGGSITKLDSLYGGLLVQEYMTGSKTWTPILPYSFYVSWDGWLEKSLDNVQKFKDRGYNIIHIVPNAGLPNEAFDFTKLNMFLDKCDELGLWVMYDMRWTYTNLSSVEEQVNIIKSRKSMLLWYTADEPDGHGDPLDAPKKAYDLIKSMDPWHPVSLCLNCYNFHYEEYSSGADIILSDVYPIAVSTKWSGVYHTVCNVTYGCCGCDDCEGNFEDVSHRLDRYSEYQTWLHAGPKTLWGTPQAFGNESYWRRAPTTKEELVMTMLSINHNAKGIVMWVYPTNPYLINVTSDLSQVLVTLEVARFLLGAPTVALEVSGHQRIDTAGWMVDNRMLVSIVYLEYSTLPSQVEVILPPGARSISRVLWGSHGWIVSRGRLLKNDGLDGLETDLVVVEFE